MAKLKLIEKYRKIMETLLLQGQISEAAILKHLLRTYAINPPNPAKPIQRNLYSLSAGVHRRSYRDTVNTVLSQYPLTDNNLPSFILEIDKQVSLLPHGNVQGDFYALWIAFFSLYPYSFDPNGKRIHLDAPVDDPRPLSVLRSCWMTAELFNRKKIQNAFYMRSSFCYDHDLKFLAPYLSLNQREEIIRVIFNSILENPDPVTIDEFEILGACCHGTSTDERVHFASKFMEFYERVTQTERDLFFLLIPDISDSLSETDINRFIESFWSNTRNLWHYQNQALRVWNHLNPEQRIFFLRCMLAKLKSTRITDNNRFIMKLLCDGARLIAPGNIEETLAALDELDWEDKLGNETWVLLPKMKLQASDTIRERLYQLKITEIPEPDYIFPRFSPYLSPQLRADLMNQLSASCMPMLTPEERATLLNSMLNLDLRQRENSRLLRRISSFAHCFSREQTMHLLEVIRAYPGYIEASCREDTVIALLHNLDPLEQDRDFKKLLKRIPAKNISDPTQFDAFLEMFKMLELYAAHHPEQRVATCIRMMKICDSYKGDSDRYLRLSALAAIERIKAKINIRKQLEKAKIPKDVIKTFSLGE